LDDGQAVLRHRVAALDEQGGNTARRPVSSTADLVDADIVTFIHVLDDVTPGDYSTAPALSAAVADEIVSGCRMLGRLESAVPELVDGPISRDSQYWVYTGKPPWVRPRQENLSLSSFVPISKSTGGSVKPSDSGLYTSTGFLGTQGMWRRYLELQPPSPSLFQLPWYVWHLQAAPTAKVAEIRTASDWADLVNSHPIIDEGLAYPDWLAIADDYDGVHMTLPAIVATEGIRLLTALAPLAPGYWGVEGTFWLRWRFSDLSKKATIATYTRPDGSYLVRTGKP
jgi:hypothetical protein